MQTKIPAAARSRPTGEPAGAPLDQAPAEYKLPMDERNDYWFPAKRFGWGWGLPVAWQGWVVLAVFLALVLLGAVTLLPARGSGAFVAYTAVLCVALVVVCVVKGEPPGRGRGRTRR